MTSKSVPHDPSIVGCVDALKQCQVLLAWLSEEVYSTRYGGRSAIGAHLRHSLDHLVALVRGLPVGLVDYDSRDRDPKLETNPAAAHAVLSDLIESLSGLGPAQFEQPLHVRQIPAPGAEPVTVPSNLRRELLFLMSHTIHHLAVMKLLSEQQGIQCDHMIGLAYSTAAHEQRQGNRDLAEPGVG